MKKFKDLCKGDVLYAISCGTPQRFTIIRPFRITTTNEWRVTVLDIVTGCYHEFWIPKSIISKSSHKRIGLELYASKEEFQKGASEYIEWVTKRYDKEITEVSTKLMALEKAKRSFVERMENALEGNFE